MGILIAFNGLVLLLTMVLFGQFSTMQKEFTIMQRELRNFNENFVKRVYEDQKAMLAKYEQTRVRRLKQSEDFEVKADDMALRSIEDKL